MSETEGEVILAEDPKGHHYDATSITVLEGLEAVVVQEVELELGINGGHFVGNNVRGHNLMYIIFLRFAV